MIIISKNVEGILDFFFFCLAQATIQVLASYLT